MMRSVSGAGEPGWYPDENPYLVRFWDGQRWTDQTESRVFGPPVPLADLPSARVTLRGRSGTAVAPRLPPASRPRVPHHRARGARLLLAAVLVCVALSIVAGLVVSLGRGVIDDLVDPVHDGTPAASSSASPRAGGSRPRRPFLSCAGAKKAGAAPLTVDHPRWNPELDPDGDGVACGR